MPQRAAFAHETQGRNQHGWYNTSDDYHVHVTKVERMTSTLGGPHYPNLHNFFNNKLVTLDELATPQEEHVPMATDKALVTESAVQIEKPKHVKIKDVKKARDVDADADSYIQQIHKGFGISRWTTMKA
ncbi:hypothetical protein ACHQM5_011043 [Ranunculus cassubicifolius]